MKHFLEKLMARFWNRTVARRRHVPLATGLLLGFRVVDEVVTASKVIVPHFRRATHLALLGRTGTGKSSLIRWFCEQDVRGDRNG
jgi:GTP-binding protein EngB required for normal cell division